MAQNNRVLTAICALAILGATSAAAQSSSDTASATASVDIVSAISISSTVNMDFGDVVAGATAGTVVLGTDGARSVTGGATLGNASGAAAASFSVTGDADSTYAITLPSSVTITDGTNNMTVDAFTSNPNGTGTLTAGSDTIAVGATLNVGASQVAGAYSGSFDVTVAYN